MQSLGKGGLKKPVGAVLEQAFEQVEDKIDVFLELKRILREEPQGDPLTVDWEVAKIYVKEVKRIWHEKVMMTEFGKEI